MSNLKFLDQISVLVVGDIMLDQYSWGDVKRISPEAPVPVINVEKTTFTLGGAANVALNLANLGVKIELVGLVGNDDPGRQIYEISGASRIKLDPKCIRDGINTITKHRVIAQRQQVCRIDKEDLPSVYNLLANENLRWFLEKIDQYDVIIVSDYAKGVISDQLVEMVAKSGSRSKRFVSIDPKPKRSLDFSGADLLTPNWIEANQMVGKNFDEKNEAAIDEVCAAIREKYFPNILAVTLGEDGMVIFDQNGKKHCFATDAKEVADVSGAGDTVIALLSICLAGGLPIDIAANLANIAAGLVVGKLGTATITRDELFSNSMRIFNK
jgi:rfaE bifunctional protein kinase chain/domain